MRLIRALSNTRPYVPIRPISLDVIPLPKGQFTWWYWSVTDYHGHVLDTGTARLRSTAVRKGNKALAKARA